MAAQEPSDAVEGVGVAVESPCDAVTAQETSKDKVEDVAVTESLCDAVASQETPKVEGIAVTESPCHTVASQEAPKVEDVVPESLCDTVASQEIPKVENFSGIESPCHAVATQVTPEVREDLVTESSCHAVATQITPDAGADVVTESRSDVEVIREMYGLDDDVEVVVIECEFDTSKLSPSEIDSFDRDVMAFSAVKSSEGNIPLSMETDFSLNIHVCR